MKLKCPYCEGDAPCVDSKVIYGRSYGMIYRCEPCNAYVGCHRGTETPLGTLANEATREARKSAHGAFDGLWKGGTMTRGEAYRWLQERMEMTPDECHMGRMNEEQARRVCQIVHDFRQENKRKKLQRRKR